MKALLRTITCPKIKQEVLAFELINLSIFLHVASYRAWKCFLQR